MHRLEAKDIQFYNRPALGYQVIVFVQQGVSRSLPEGKYLGIHPTLSSVIEYQYGSADHWSRTKTRLDARIYPFGGIIRDMRLVPDSQAAVLSSCGRHAFQDLGRASHGIRLVSGN